MIPATPPALTELAATSSVRYSPLSINASHFSSRFSSVKSLPSLIKNKAAAYDANLVLPPGTSASNFFNLIINTSNVVNDSCSAIVRLSEPFFRMFPSASITPSLYASQSVKGCVNLRKIRYTTYKSTKFAILFFVSLLIMVHHTKHLCLECSLRKSKNYSECTCSYLLS